MFQKIVTHAGAAHRDDLLSCCFALALHPEINSVERRDPTPDEIADPDVLVLDVGGVYDAPSSDFDHHQFARGTEPRCAMSLYLEFEGLLPAFKLQDWWEPTIRMDATGPFQTAGWLGVKPEAILQLESPLERAIVGLFETSTILSSGDLSSLRLLGKAVLDKVLGFAKKLEELQLLTVVIEIRGVKALKFNTKDTEATQKFRDSRHPDAAISVALDDRGPGLALYRFNDHERVDFSKVKGDPAVLFSHPGGFIAKTKGIIEGEALVNLLSAAIK